MRKHLFRLVFLATTLVATLAACSTSDAPKVAPAPAVSVTTLKTQAVTLTRELAGRTSPFLVAEVRPQVNGLVKQRLFTEGGLVEASQVLYRIDDASYRAAANSAKAQLSRAEATRTAARLRAARMAELARIGAVSTQDNENAIAAAQQAEADVGAARAALDAANVTLGHARITAPINGRIGKSTVTQGALVTANQPQALATIQQLDPIHVDLTQSSSELLQLRKELANGTLESTRTLPVTILLEDGTEFPHKGTLEFAEVSVDPGTGSYNLRVTVDNPEQILMPGMYVRARVGSGLREAAVLAPMQGIARDPKGETSAMLVNAEGKIEQRAVKVSRTIGDQWLVEEGLAAGDRVVVAGLQKIKPGIQVQVTEVDPGSAPETRDPAAMRATDPAPATAASTQ